MTTLELADAADDVTSALRAMKDVEQVAYVSSAIRGFVLIRRVTGR